MEAESRAARAVKQLQLERGRVEGVPEKPASVGWLAELPEPAVRFAQYQQAVKLSEWYGESPSPASLPAAPASETASPPARSRQRLPAQRVPLLESLLEPVWRRRETPSRLPGAPPAATDQSPSLGWHRLPLRPPQANRSEVASLCFLQQFRRLPPLFRYFRRAVTID